MEMSRSSVTADPTRRTILELLANRGELAATAIYEQFPVSPQAVSQHLKVLREAQLVEMEKRAHLSLSRIFPKGALRLCPYGTEERKGSTRPITALV